MQMISVTIYERKPTPFEVSIPSLGFTFKQVDSVTPTGTGWGGKCVIGTLPDGTEARQAFDGTWHQCQAADTGETWCARDLDPSVVFGA